eukprot:GSMAST32.ASY1.ANO1.1559.1 assembled CDS
MKLSPQAKPCYRSSSSDRKKWNTDVQNNFLDKVHLELTMSFYDVLGVSKTATTRDIKKAFRKLALKEHPDKGGDPERFKQIAQAYETLVDDAKRRDYDQVGSTSNMGGGFQSRGFHTPFSFQRAEDVFAAFFGNDDFMRGSSFSGFGGDDFFGGTNRSTNRSTNRNTNDNRSMMFPGFGGGFFGRSAFDMSPFGGDPFGGDSFGRGFHSSGMSSFASSSSSSNRGGYSKSVSTRSHIGPDGRRITTTTTTVRHPDGREETDTTTTTNGPSLENTSGRRGLLQ